MSAKLRPALVLYEGERDVVAAFISSRLPEEDSPESVLIGDGHREFQLTGLKVSSVVRLDKVATVLKDLVVGEIGDNFKIWGTYRLYFVEEPEIKSGSDADTRGKLDLRRTLVFRYEDGNHNCEALALDSGRKEILLVTKTPGGGGEAGVYRMALPDLGFEASVDASDDTSTTQTADAPAPLPSIEPDESLRLDSGPEIETARKIATLKLPTVTAMDISACGCYAVVLTYGNAYYYERDEDETWAQAFARPPRMVPLPVRRQGESIGFGSDGKSLYLTSEKLPTPLWHLPPADSMD